MLRSPRAGLIVAPIALFILVCTSSQVAAGPQEQAKDQRPAHEDAAKDEGLPRFSSPLDERIEAEIGKMIAAYDLKPHPLPPIPDNPPPHEGALIGLPYVVMPPDLVLVEVLEALPGRPISGERLVRPDGTIDLGFYGEISVLGLTLPQVKVALIKHLRKFLTDEALGLKLDDEEGVPPSALIPVPFPDTPKSPGSAHDSEGMQPRSSSYRPRLSPRPLRPRSASRRAAGGPVPLRPVLAQSAHAAAQDQDTPAQASNQIKIPAGGKGRITITIEVDGQGTSSAEQHPPAPPNPSADDIRRKISPPEESATVFVDVTAYNSNNYYVLGDVAVTGRLPWTGNETILDALAYAGGLLASAEPKDIRLVRPGRGGKPSKIYKIDLAGIQEKGDVHSNYQIFPNDRLIVGRNEVVKKTTEIDRLNAPILSIAGTMLQEAFLLRALQFVATDKRDALLKEYVDFWAKELSRPDGLKFDEQTLRDAFIRRMKITPPPLTPAPVPR
jgi:protein involved in polysaccharide export with SLBB domain